MAEPTGYFDSEHRPPRESLLFVDPETYPENANIQPVALPDPIVEPVPELTPESLPTTDDTFYQGANEGAYTPSTPGMAGIGIPSPSQFAGTATPARTGSTGSRTPSTTGPAGFPLSPLEGIGSPARSQSQSGSVLSPITGGIPARFTPLSPLSGTLSPPRTAANGASPSPGDGGFGLPALPSFAGVDSPASSVSNGRLPTDYGGLDAHFVADPNGSSHFGPTSRPVSNASHSPSQHPHAYALNIPTQSELEENLAYQRGEYSPSRRSGSGSGSGGSPLSPRTELLSPPAQHNTPGPSRHTGKERARLKHQSQRAGEVRPSELIQLIVNEEYKARQTRSLLDATNTQLAAEQQRVATAQNTTMELMQQLRLINDARLSSERDLARVSEELRLYRLQYDQAQKEITRAQEIVNRARMEYDDAEAAATRAKNKTQKWKDEQLYTRAREEGRRMGFKEGMEFGRRVGFSDGRDRGFKAGTRAIALAIDDDSRTTSSPTSEVYPAEDTAPPAVVSQGEIHGGDGTFSPVGASRPGIDATQADAVLAGANYMPAAHEEIRNAPPAHDNNMPRHGAIPPDGWVPVADVTGFMNIPAPNELSERPVSPVSSLGANSLLTNNKGGAGGLPPASVELYRRGGRADPSPAMHVREFGSMNTVPDPSSVFSPQSGRPGVPRDRLSIVPSIVPEVVASDHMSDDRQSRSSRHSKGTILSRARKAFGGGYASSQPATIVEGEEEGWTDVGESPAKPRTVEQLRYEETPQRPGPPTPAQTYAAVTRERDSLRRPSNVSAQNLGAHYASSTGSAPAISIVAPSSEQRSVRSSMQPQARGSPLPPRARSPSGPRAPSPNNGGAYYVTPSAGRQPMALDHAPPINRPIPSPGRRTINLDTPPQGTPIEPPIILEDPSRSAPPMTPNTGHTALRRVPSASSMVSRGSFRSFNPDDYVDPAFLASPNVRPAGRVMA